MIYVFYFLNPLCYHKAMERKNTFQSQIKEKDRNRKEVLMMKQMMIQAAAALRSYYQTFSVNF